MKEMHLKLHQPLVVPLNTPVLDSAERGRLRYKSSSILLCSLCLSTRPEVVKLVLHGLNSDGKHILFGCTVFLKMVNVLPLQ